VLSEEATNTNLTVFGLTHNLRSEHANHYTTDAVNNNMKYVKKKKI
jgi:hypothetical protein